MPLDPVDIPLPANQSQCDEYLTLANDALSQNSQIIDTVVGKIRAAVLGTIDTNKKAIRKINGKINRVVNRTTALQGQALDSMVQKIGSVVGGALTANAAALNDIALRTSLSAGTATSATGALTPVSLDTVLYRLYVKCDTKQLAPFLSTIDPNVVANAGWSLAAPQTFASGADAMQWGQLHFAEIVSTVCRPQPTPTGPRVPLPPVTTGPGGIPGLPTSPVRTVAGGSTNVVPPIPANGPCPAGLDPRNIAGSGAQWVVYVDCFGDVDNTGKGVYVTTVAQAFSQAANFAPPYGNGGRKLIAGPFQTSSDAETWIAASGGVNDIMSVCCGIAPPGGLPGSSTPPTIITPPPPPPQTTTPPAITPPAGATCPPPPCEYTYQEGSTYTSTSLQSFPILNCPLAIGGKLPPVGSVEWCQCLDSITDWFNRIGLWFVQGLGDTNGSTDVGGLLGSFQEISGALTGTILPIKFLQQIADQTKGRMNDHWTQLFTAISSFGITVGAELLGITLCRTLLRLLHNARVGWDLAIWATIDIEVVIDPLEKLLSYVEGFAFQWEIPGIGEAIDCLLQHTAPVEQCYCWMECHGANPLVYAPVIDARREKLHDDELIEWARRHELDDGTITQLLQDQGWHRTGEAIARVELSYELPTIQDHLHWLQRNVFDTAYVTDYFLLDGFDTQDNIRTLPGLASYVVGPEAPQRNFWDAFGSDLHALGMRKEYAANHYAAHWINPSIGQLAEMMQRLRPGRVDPTIQFTSVDFERVIAEQDVAPYFRKRVEAISFRTLPIRQLNSAVKHGLFDEAEITQRWMDIGFTVDDAPLIAKATVIDATRQQVAAAHGYTPSVVAKLAAYDMIPVELAQQYLNPQGFSNTEIDTLFTVAKQERALEEEKTRGKKATNDYANLALKAYADGIVNRDTVYNALRATGYSDEAANLEINTTALRVRTEKINAAVKSIRKAFLRGEVNAQQAIQILITAGVFDYSAADYVQRWTLEMTVPRQAATTQLILKWAKDGIISIANAEQRLINIGWSQQNIDLHVAELEQSIKIAQARAAKLKARELAIAQAAAQRALTLTQKQFCKLFTPSKMILWYSERIIDDGTFRDRLAKCGNNAEQIDDLFKQATVAREHKDAQAAKKGASGIQYTGPGSVTS